MRAIAELTLLRQLRHIRERIRNPFAGIPKLQFSHSRRIEQHSSARNNNQLPRCCCVPPFVITLACFCSRLQFAAEDGIDERRFPDARRSEKRGCAAGSHELAQLSNSFAAHNASDDDANAHCNVFGVMANLRNFFTEVGLVENNDGASSAFPCERQVSFDTACVEFAIQGTDEKHGVDVRSNDLLFGFLAGDFARELAAPSKYKFDLGPTTALSYEHPIADGGQHFARNRFVAEFSAQLGPDFTEF